MPERNFLSKILEKFAVPRFLPSYGTDLQVNIAPRYAERTRIQKALEREALGEPTQEAFTGESGDYSLGYSSHLSKDMIRMLHQPEINLDGDELFIYHQIRSLLTDPTRVEPVSCVDLGGMYGISFIRIAKYFADEIKSGKLKMTITNLHFQPAKVETNVRSNRRQEIERILPDEDFLFWQENHHLVDFINCLPSNLPENIDILYEHNSVTYHSFTPAEHRLIMLSKLHQGGILISTDHISPSTNPDKEHFKADLSREMANFNHALTKSEMFGRINTISINGNDY